MSDPYWRNDDQVKHYRQGYEQGQRDALAAAVQRVEALWGSSWCGLRYPTCDDPDHACRYRREVIAAIKGEQA